MPKMECFCGTFKTETFEIELDDYDKPITTGATNDQMSEAFKLLRNELCNYDFANDHYRNNCAVNTCIALHVMGYNAETWLENFCEEQKLCNGRWFIDDLDKFMKHVKRVVKYLPKWGPKDYEGDALNYTV